MSALYPLCLHCGRSHVTGLALVVTSAHGDEKGSAVYRSCKGCGAQWIERGSKVEWKVRPKRPPPVIVKTRGVCGGRPCFEGTRLCPTHLWSWFEAGNSVDRILTEYPGITRAHIAMSRQLYAEARRFFRGRER